MSAGRKTVRSLAGPAGVVVIVVSLHLLGRGLLSPPPLGSRHSFRLWAEARDPVTVGFACVRLVALAVAYHLLATSLLALAGHALRRPHLVQAAERTTLPPFRGTIRRVAGLSLTAAAALSTPLPGAGASAVAPADGPVLVRPPAAGQAMVERLDQPSPPAGVAVMRRQTVPASPGPADVTEAADPASASTPGEPTRRVVGPGDHLWGIAEELVGGHLGHPPSDAEVTAYWLRLVTANPQLADPDLLFPGDSVVLPPLER